VSVTGKSRGENQADQITDELQMSGYGKLEAGFAAVFEQSPGGDQWLPVPASVFPINGSVSLLLVQPPKLDNKQDRLIQTPDGPIVASGFVAKNPAHRNAPTTS